MEYFFEEQRFNHFGQGTDIKGELRLSGIIKVSGKIEGNLYIDDNSEFTLDWSGIVEGNIYCYDCAIYGTFHGQIFSKGKVIIHPSAKVSGSIDAKKLVIYPGATVNMEGHTQEAPL